MAKPPVRGRAGGRARRDGARRRTTGNGVGQPRPRWPAIRDADALGSDALRDPWRNQGSINYPGDPAVSGAGYSVLLTSKTCQAVSHTDETDKFAGVGKGSEQDVDERGNMSVCSGCLRGGGCDDLVKI